MKSRKVMTILLSLAIMFTFMPAMAFADSYKTADLPTSGGTISDITWSADYHTASVTIKDQGTWDFEYFDNLSEVEATKAEYKSSLSDGLVKFVVYPTNYEAGEVTYGLGIAKATTGTKYDYCWELKSGDFVEYFDLGYADKGTGRAKYATREVYDASFIAAYQSEVNNASNDGSYVVDAADYASWYAQKDLATAARFNKTVGGFGSTDGLSTVGNCSKKYLNIEYPAYAGYEYDTNAAGKKVDKTLAIDITLNQAAILEDDDEALFSTATGSVPMVAKISSSTLSSTNGKFYTGARADYDYEIGWYITDNSKYNKDYDETYDNEITYDGNAHTLAWIQEPTSVTKKFYVVKADKNGKYAAPKDADWTTTFPETIKDAGKYLVAIQLVSEKNTSIKSNSFEDTNGNGFVDSGEMTYEIVEVDAMPIVAEFKQDVLEVEYGKYNATSLEAAIKNMLVVKRAPDSTDKLEEAVQKYMTITGLFEDAGANKVSTVFNDKSFSDDTELSAALSNYSIEDGDKMLLVIKKAENNVNLKAVNKTYKAKKKTKKLAKKKSFQLEATAQFGTVAYKKVSGNSKISVSSTGKVTVKKGLKKGTYKVKVKAYTEGTANYAAGADTQTIVVKVK